MEPFEPLISTASGSWGPRELRRLDRPDRAVLELDRRLERVVDLDAPGMNVAGRRSPKRCRRRGSREVDDVRSEIAERSGAGDGLVEAPRSSAGWSPQSWR